MPQLQHFLTVEAAYSVVGDVQHLEFGRLPEEAVVDASDVIVGDTQLLQDDVIPEPISVHPLHVVIVEIEIAEVRQVGEGFVGDLGDVGRPEAQVLEIPEPREYGPGYVAQDGVSQGYAQGVVGEPLENAGAHVRAAVVQARQLVAADFGRFEEGRGPAGQQQRHQEANVQLRTRGQI